MARLPVTSNMSATRKVNNSDTDISDRNGQGSNCRSPLGATPRPPLPQQYRLPNGSALYKMDQQKNGHRLVTSNGMGSFRASGPPPPED